MGNKVYSCGNCAGYSEKKTQVSICEHNLPFIPTQPILPQSGIWVGWAKHYTGIGTEKASKLVKECMCLNLEHKG